MFDATIKAISTFMQYLPALKVAAKSVPEVMEYIKETKATLATTKEWTAENEADFNKRLEEVTSQEHWQPETNGNPGP